MKTERIPVVSGTLELMKSGIKKFSEHIAGSHQPQQSPEDCPIWNSTHTTESTINEVTFCL